MTARHYHQVSGNLVGRTNVNTIGQLHDEMAAGAGERLAETSSEERGNGKSSKEQGNGKYNDTWEEDFPL